MVHPMLLLTLFIFHKKMGRKRSANSENKIYFSQTEETAVVEYLNAHNAAVEAGQKMEEARNNGDAAAEEEFSKLKSVRESETEEIFRTKIQEPLSKLVECVIKRYKLFIPDEEWEETFHDCLGHVAEKFKKFEPNRGCKAYSYFGTVAKHYMLYRIKKYHDELLRYDKYDLNPNQYEESEKYAEEQYSVELDGLTMKIVNDTKQMFQSMLDHKKMYEISEGETRIGEALIELLDNWETIFTEVELSSQKFNKAFVLLYLKETTLMPTKEIRKFMKKFKHAYERVRDSVQMEVFN